MWQCPLCETPLMSEGKHWRCENAHHFDEAKSGYLNLLPVQFKKSRHPGDDKTMLNARRRFHDFGSYRPLMQAILGRIQQAFLGADSLSLFDAGCGEGSYLEYLRQSLESQGINCTAAGTDIAKHAVDIAAKRFKSCRFAVATSVKLPLTNASQQVVLQVFAPGNSIEYARILTNDGMLITVDPAQNHLWQLKSKLYDTPRKHNIETPPMPGLELWDTEFVSFKLDLQDDEQRMALLQMTPYYWRLAEDKAKLVAQELDFVEADFVVRVWKKASTQAAMQQ